MLYLKIVFNFLLLSKKETNIISKVIVLLIIIEIVKLTKLLI